MGPGPGMGPGTGTVSSRGRNRDNGAFPLTGEDDDTDAGTVLRIEFKTIPSTGIDGEIRVSLAVGIGTVMPPLSECISIILSLLISSILISFILL